jgi:hypothetical protein
MEKQDKAGTSRGKLTLAQLWERARRYGPPVGGESAAALIRRERDSRSYP